MNDQLAALFGGVEMTVKLNTGGTENVKVRQLKVSELTKYAAVVEDDARCIELFCAKPAGWADNLELGCAVELLEKGHEFNADFLARSAARKSALREKLVPGYRDLVKKIVESHLPSSAPGSPPKPG